jgi:hypothetical protein
MELCATGTGCESGFRGAADQALPFRHIRDTRRASLRVAATFNNESI